MEVKHLYDIALYPDLLDSIALTSESIMSQIQNYKLDFPKIRDERVEWKMGFPIFVDSFYEYILLNSVIPSQFDFYEYYLSYNDSFFGDESFRKEEDLDKLMSALQARVYRAYPSLVRDIHFNKYVQEKIVGYKVSYNRILDVVEGIDLMISDRVENWGVCLYTDTPRAYKGRSAKEDRHRHFDNVNYIELPVTFGSGFNVGYFYLYGNKEYKRLMELLSKGLNHNLSMK